MEKIKNSSVEESKSVEEKILSNMDSQEVEKIVKHELKDEKEKEIANNVYEVKGWDTLWSIIKDNFWIEDNTEIANKIVKIVKINEDGTIKKDSLSIINWKIIEKPDWIPWDLIFPWDKIIIKIDEKTEINNIEQIDNKDISYDEETKILTFPGGQIKNVNSYYPETRIISAVDCSGFTGDVSKLYPELEGFGKISYYNPNTWDLSSSLCNPLSGIEWKKSYYNIKTSPQKLKSFQEEFDKLSEKSSLEEISNFFSNYHEYDLIDKAKKLLTEERNSTDRPFVDILKYTKNDNKIIEIFLHKDNEGYYVKDKKTYEYDKIWSIKASCVVSYLDRGACIPKFLDDNGIKNIGNPSLILGGKQLETKIYTECFEDSDQVKKRIENNHSETNIYEYDKTWKLLDHEIIKHE